MTQSSRTASPLARRLAVPALALAALSLSATAAIAGPDLVRDADPSIRVEAERSMQGARIDVRGKDWPAGAVVHITTSRPPGSNDPVDLGYKTADEKGEFRLRKATPCTTQRMDDANLERVVVMARDTVSGVTATTRADSGAWVCM